MNASLFSSFLKHTAYSGLPARRLDFSIGSGSKNLVSKATQLVEDLAVINARTHGGAFYASEKKGLTPVEFAEKQLTDSIRKIKSLRAQRGIETPPNAVTKNDILQAFLKDARGALLNKSA